MKSFVKNVMSAWEREGFSYVVKNAPKYINRRYVSNLNRLILRQRFDDSGFLLEVDVYSCRGRDPAVAFLHRLPERHDVSDAEFLVDGAGYLTTLACHELSDQLDYSERNHIKNGSRLSPSNRPPHSF